jgi:CTP-dependent riboflavin kinase
MKGIFVSGLERGKSFVSDPYYLNFFEDALGKKPFFGTINLLLDKENLFELESRKKAFQLNAKKIKNTDAKEHNKIVARKKDSHILGVEQNFFLIPSQNVFGAVKFFGAKIFFEGKSFQCVLVEPEKTVHKKNVVEFVCKEKLPLKKGCVVNFFLK